MQQVTMAFDQEFESEQLAMQEMIEQLSERGVEVEVLSGSEDTVVKFTFGSEQEGVEELLRRYHRNVVRRQKS